MGVQGLWKLIAPCGKMVPLEGMSNKVLAIDVSIWLHQALTGVHEVDGAAAVLLLLFHRLCKLLFYKIRPVFVFDGGVPALKRQTMASRRMKKNKARSEATRIRTKLLKNMLKHEALRRVLADDNLAAPDLNAFTLPGPWEEEDLYKLPEKYSSQASDSNSESGSDSGSLDTDAIDLDSVDVSSSEFRSLPAELRHDILSDLKDTRKQNSWRNIDQMPDNSQEFSNFQMNRLLKRRAIQVSLEECGKEMIEKDVSIQELQSMLGDVASSSCRLVAGRIAQDDSARFMLLQHAPSSTVTKSPLKAEKPPEEHELKNIAETLKNDEAVSEVNKETFQPNKNEIASIVKAFFESAADQAEKKILEPKNDVEKMECDETREESQDIAIIEKTEPSVANNLPEKILRINKNLVPTISKVDLDIIKVLDSSTDDDDSNSLESSKPEIINLVPPDDFDNSVVQEMLKPNEDNIDKIVSETAGEIISVTAEKIVSETAEKIVSETAEEIISETAEEIIRETAEKIVSETAEDIVSETAEEIVNETAPSPLLAEPEPEDSSDTDPDDFIPVQTPGNNLAAVAEEMSEALARERNVLIDDQARQKRLQQTVSDQIYTDAQELLRLFGVPYVVAPMEAEAQCATLESLGLTNGTITDDSDIWLFGGRVVYKDFFNQKKRVQQFRSDEIEKILKLTREELVRLAMLVGSDYTSGLAGVGPVTALEILAAFPPPAGAADVLSGLRNFREWLSSGFVKGPTKVSLKNKLKNTELVPDFPNNTVAEAYFNPHVDQSKEAFSWSKPDLAMLEKYTRIKFGWSSDRCNQQLTPVMKKLLEKNEQPSILRYFETASPTIKTVDGLLSKRVEGAVKRLGCPSDEFQNEPQPGSSHSEPGMDPLMERLHKKTTIPQREKERLKKEQLKKRAAKILQKSNKKPKMAQSQPVDRINLSESSSDGD